MEIKFRAILLDQNFGEKTDVSWVYGSLNVFDNGSRSIRYYSDNGVSNKVEVNPITVCQYINLKDEKGKEIYVGDIGYLQTNWGERLKCVVEFCKAGFIFSYISRNNKKKCIFAQDVALNKMKFEIIGNIYENPGLTLNLPYK